MADKWKQLEQSLDGLFCYVKVKADGHEVTFVKRKEGQRLIIAVFVDGVMEGDWYKAKDEKPVYPQARFWCPKRGRPWPLKQYAGLKKIYGKREADQMTAMKTLAFLPAWGSPKSLVRHLKKNFPDLAVLEETHV
ncbi:hypothetical protein [Thalassospira xiamenensis]|uniref:Uncharacterized protein n=1 Tax=Thalassospira xiamenensis TaxID=220697 RepID=A0A367XHS2_9PROT|nr:hypothetical protein [Thalassospira xiamenensis]KZB51107.1 hypothetical protein AUP41_08355 [Thalassospira xiamenensis]RCK53188.1 hypothetical protein TH44_03045 [Thalassospira xiamenensis]